MDKISENRGIKIDKEVLLIINKAAEKAGSFRKLAIACNLSPMSISRWCGGVTGKSIDCIDWPSWEKVWMYLTKEEIISPEDVRWMPPSVLREAMITGKVKPASGSNVDFNIPKLTKFPVISLAAAAEVNTTYYPLAQYADQYSEETATFTAGQPGDFVIRVCGESMKPWYPPGTLLLVRPHQHIKNGDRVIAVLGDGEVVFKCFVERKKTIMLVAINGEGGKNFEFQKNDFAAIRDLYKVIQSLRIESEVDSAMHEKGVKHFWQQFEEE
jgi:SOS-response transcriptional repressor LexA